MANATPETPKTESFYQSTPRVDTDIGPLTFIPQTILKNSTTASTLPSDPTTLPSTYRKPFNSNNNELPQNMINEARANLQSHVSDFFQQISVAGSPEDVMEAGCVPYGKSRLFPRNSQHSCHPKLAKIAKLHTRNKTPYHTKFQERIINEIKTTPLSRNLSRLKIDQDIPKYENIDNTVTEIMTNKNDVKKVADILIQDPDERRLVQNSSSDKLKINLNNENLNDYETINESHIYETILEINNDSENNHNDSSISSASQLLEDPSPMSWLINSPDDDNDDDDGRFTLKRQRGIRRKRQKKNHDNNDSSANKKAKIHKSSSISPESRRKILETGIPIFEAFNYNVKKLPLETDFDATIGDEINFKTTTTPLFCHSKDDVTKVNMWDLDSPKSSLIDDYQSSKGSFIQSVSETPEAPLIATVRRCLKYSPEFDNNGSKLHTRGSIEIEYNATGDFIHIKGKYIFYFNILLLFYCFSIYLETRFSILFFVVIEC